MAAHTTPDASWAIGVKVFFYINYANSRGLIGLELLSMGVQTYENDVRGNAILSGAVDKFSESVVSCWFLNLLN